MNNYNEEMYADRYPEIDELYKNVFSSNTEMNVNWMRNNPELAVESIIKFFETHSDKHFNHTCDTRFVPSTLH